MRHRWLVLALSTLALVAGVTVMATSGIATTPPRTGPSETPPWPPAIEERAGLYGTPTETVVATAKDGSLTEAEVTAIGPEPAAAYRGVDNVAAVGDPQPGADGRSVVLTLTLDAEDEPAEGSSAPDTERGRRPEPRVPPAPSQRRTPSSPSGRSARAP